MLHVDDVTAPAAELPGLRERKYDLLLVRLISDLAEEQLSDDLRLQRVVEDQLVIAAGAHSRWASYQKLSLRDLIEAPWILGPSGTWNRRSVEKSFLAAGLQPPKPRVISVSMALRVRLLIGGPFVAALPKTVLQLNRDLYLLKSLPIPVQNCSGPVAVITMKRRTLSPVVERLITCIHEVAESLVDRVPPRAKRKGG